MSPRFEQHKLLDLYNNDGLNYVAVQSTVFFESNVVPIKSDYNFSLAKKMPWDFKANLNNLENGYANPDTARANHSHFRMITIVNKKKLQKEIRSRMCQCDTDSI